MTLKTRVIPCLDVKDGRVVKGVNFVDLVDAGDPVESAIAYDAAGADELCFLDITASHEGRDTIYDVVARTAEHCFMPLTVGGGIRTVEDIRKLLLSFRHEPNHWGLLLKSATAISSTFTTINILGYSCIIPPLKGLFDTTNTWPNKPITLKHSWLSPLTCLP